ncbi:hypothetical protein ACI3L3_09365 [Desulfobaculum sp. SPO524]|uniref:hypothetical protein n=1 Tax=Desulfobaculum sp. SPO524 TaxID=3378071 RepID=UPI0038538D1C
MPNMDYPGPCPNCQILDQCASEEARKKSVEHYCKGMEMELNSWKARLFDVFAETDKHADMKDTLEQIKSVLREIEMQMEKMRFECPTSLEGVESEVGRKFEDLRTHYTKAMSVISPGWFGG